VAKKAARKFTAEELLRIKSAKAWRPAVGETITGKIVIIAPRTGDYGVYPVIVLDISEDSYTAVHAFHGVIKNELKAVNAQRGMDITIQYHGKREHNSAVDGDGNARKYHGYSVVPVDGAELEEYTFDFEDAPAF
jgi:hypothetical protein